MNLGVFVLIFLAVLVLNTLGIYFGYNNAIADHFDLKPLSLYAALWAAVLLQTIGGFFRGSSGGSKN